MISRITPKMFFSTVIKIPEMGLVAEKIAASRFSCRNFDDKPIAEGHLERILGYTQRMCTSMNIQPYRIVVSRDKESKEQLRECLVGGNQISTKNAAAFVTFICDINPCQNMDKFEKMLQRSNTPQKSIDSHISYFKKVYPPNICMKNLPKNLVTPFVPRAEQNTGLVIGAFIDLCTAYGLATLAMTGIIKEKIIPYLGVPPGYSVCMVCAVGYAAEGAHAFETARYLPNEVIYENKFGSPMLNVLDTNPKSLKN